MRLLHVTVLYYVLLDLSRYSTTHSSCVLTNEILLHHILYCAIRFITWAKMFMSVGEAFYYLNPSFAVLEVDFRQIRMKGYKAAGNEINYVAYTSVLICHILPSRNATKRTHLLTQRYTSYSYSGK